MIDIGVKIPKIKVEIETPVNKAFWSGVGQLTTDTIRLRTETDGEDVDQKKFSAYSPEYAKRRAAGKAQKGVGKRGRNVTMSMSGRMLSAMKRGIRARRAGVSIVLSGEDGMKAYGIESYGKRTGKRREFFDISKKNAKKILESVDKWMSKKNGLK